MGNVAKQDEQIPLRYAPNAIFDPAALQRMYDGAISDLRGYPPVERFRGRVEAVHLQWPTLGKAALGKIIRADQVVVVKYGDRFLDQVVLARFDNYDSRVKELKERGGNWRMELSQLYPNGVFISTEMPFGLEERIREKGLPPEEVVFYARQPKYIEKAIPKRSIPTLKEVNLHFESGSIGQYVYLDAKGKNEPAVTIVSPHSRVPQILDDTNIVDLLPNPMKFSRLILTNSKRGVELARQHILESGNTPIRLESHNSFRKPQKK